MSGLQHRINFEHHFFFFFFWTQTTRQTYTIKFFFFLGNRELMEGGKRRRDNEVFLKPAQRKMDEGVLQTRRKSRITSGAGTLRRQTNLNSITPAWKTNVEE